jgi:hypothetical protein
MFAIGRNFRRAHPFQLKNVVSGKISAGGLLWLGTRGRNRSGYNREKQSH